MLQIKDPCKKCLVRPVCFKGCDIKQKYYNDRQWKMPTLYVVILSVVQMAVWIVLCFLFPSFPHSRIFISIFVFGLAGIAIYIAKRFSIFNLEGSWKEWMN